MSVPYVLRYIEEGEHQRQDFKMRIDDSRKIARTLSAFANTDGGRLLIGVNDNGTVSGVRVDEETHMLESAANLHCKPIVGYTIQIWKVEYRHVMEVNIPVAQRKPVSAVNEEGLWRPYLRLNDQVVPAPAVLLEVWKNSTNERPQKYTHTLREQRIFEALGKEPGITLSRLSRITNIPRQLLTTILARLIRWQIVGYHFEQAQIRFSLNQWEQDIPTQHP